MKSICGRRFGMLVALMPVGRNKSRQTIWVVRCDCGEDITADVANMVRGHIVSCGCRKFEQMAMLGKTQYKHGHALTASNLSPTYKSWANAKQRCTDPNNNRYYAYGARGITMCDSWSKDFRSFLEDMGERPPNTSIDRINSDGNYEPGNCRWATGKQQRNNRRKTVLESVN